MFQFMPLFLEIILLGATAYIYWATRRLIITSVPSSVAISNKITGRETEIEITEMTRNLTGLLAELQVATDTAHQDLTAQKANLQQLLDQAEFAVAKLRPLLDQVEDISRPAVAGQEAKPQREIADKVSSIDEMSLTLAQALVTFRDNLSSYGYSQHTIPWVTAYTRQFLVWSHGDNWVELPLNEIDTVKVNGYINYLKDQNCPADVIERTKIALKSFMRWTDNWLKANYKTESQLETSSSHLSYHPILQTNSSFGLNRYQAVLTLAEQGLDRPTIAAQTGLEQEAIKLLLTMGLPSLVSQ